MIGTHPKLSCAIVSTLIIVEDCPLGQSLESNKPDICLSGKPDICICQRWSSRKVFWLSNVLPISNAFIFHFFTFFFLFLARSHSFFYLFVLCCSYIMRELVAKNALASSSLPTYLSDWTNVLCSLCMYTTTQTTKFFESHL